MTKYYNKKGFEFHVVESVSTIKNIMTNENKTLLEAIAEFEQLKITSENNTIFSSYENSELLSCNYWCTSKFIHDDEMVRLVSGILGYTVSDIDSETMLVDGKYQLKIVDTKTNMKMIELIEVE